MPSTCENEQFIIHINQSVVFCLLRKSRIGCVPDRLFLFPRCFPARTACEATSYSPFAFFWGRKRRAGMISRAKGNSQWRHPSAPVQFFSTFIAEFLFFSYRHALQFASFIQQFSLTPFRKIVGRQPASSSTLLHLRARESFDSCA